MVLTFSDFKIGSLDVSEDINRIFKLLSHQLKLAKVLFKASVKSKEVDSSEGRKLLYTHMVFEPIEKGKLFKSEKKQIQMKPTDPRIKKLKRSFLETERLSQEQYKVIKELTSTYLTSLGVDYKLIYEDDVFKEVLVNGSTVIKQLELPNVIKEGDSDV